VEVGWLSGANEVGLPALMGNNYITDSFSM
jgi:hypothetical protein